MFEILYGSSQNSKFKINYKSKSYYYCFGARPDLIYLCVARNFYTVTI
jgi:hypothetical protein